MLDLKDFNGEENEDIIADSKEDTALLNECKVTKKRKTSNGKQLMQNKIKKSKTNNAI